MITLQLFRVLEESVDLVQEVIRIDPDDEYVIQALCAVIRKYDSVVFDAEPGEWSEAGVSTQGFYLLWLVSDLLLYKQVDVRRVEANLRQRFQGDFDERNFDEAYLFVVEIPGVSDRACG